MADWEWLHRRKCDEDPENKQGMNRRFFPITEQEHDAETWMFYCGRCPVWKDCFVWGMQNEEYGVWGGISEEERRYHRDRISREEVTLDDVIDEVVASRAARADAWEAAQ